MTRRLHIPFLLACLALLAAAPAGAKPAKRLPPAKVAVGHPVLGTSANGLDSILVPVHYPIELKGRLAELRVALIGARGKTIRSWVLHERLNGGKERLPDRRRRFTFVHRIGLDGDLGRELGRGAAVRVLASGRLDVEGDGKAELRSRDLATAHPLAGPRPKPVCSTIPHLRVKPGARISVPLPACDTERAWTARKGSRGGANVRAGRLIYKAPQGFRGSDEVELASRSVRQSARITVGTAGNPRVRAIGDSVTAGFGYYGTGGWMGPIEFIRNCRPAAANFNDACSSNSRSKKSKEGAVEYLLPDYGLAGNVSWVAQWANEHDVTDFQNLAVSGSEPRNWGPGGTFYPTLQKMEGERPDYVLLTLGANPMLSKMLLEPSEWWCALVKGLEGFEGCIEEEFEAVDLQRWLKAVYGDLLKNTSATIYVMQYHLSIPVSAVFERTIEIARANQMLNEEIAATVGVAKGDRLKLVTPPHFNVGIELGKVYPSGTKCPPADGPSVQSWITQKDLKLFHFETFCGGPEKEGEPDWVISSDSGIHPSITGYTHMASEVPSPTGG
jgi:lysophospholipase L1-like esterase